MAIEDPELANDHSNTPHDFTSVQNPKPKIPMMLPRLLQEYPPGFYRKMIAETIATFMLVFVVCGSAGLSESDERRVSKLGASIAGGLVVTVMIYAVGHISGAHMNPAITLAFAAVRHFPWKQVPLYAAAQLTGAISAAFTLRILIEPIKQVGITSPSGSDARALIMEIVLTFSLMFITSAVATDTKAVGELAGIAIGSAVCIASILGGPISGGSMNPARSIGPAVASSYYKGLWVYLLGPVIGALTGAWAYNFIRLTDKTTGREISPSLSLKLRRMKSQQEQPTDNTPNPLDS